MNKIIKTPLDFESVPGTGAATYTYSPTITIISFCFPHENLYYHSVYIIQNYIHLAIDGNRNGLIQYCNADNLGIPHPCTKPSILPETCKTISVRASVICGQEIPSAVRCLKSRFKISGKLKYFFAMRAVSIGFS